MVGKNGIHNEFRSAIAGSVFTSWLLHMAVL